MRSAAEETERLSRLAEDLLFIARADQGALPIRAEHVRLADILETVADRFAARAAELGRTVRAEGSELEADADPERLDQALSGLVDNALRHGGGDVVLAARSGTRGDRSRSTSPTTARASRPTSTSGHSTASAARTRRGRRGGSGLGLSIVAVIAGAHGGRAGAGNRAGGGADVWISLPYAARPAPRRRAHAST